MHVVITGSAGFVGRGLVERLLTVPGTPLGRPISRLTLVDRSATAVTQSDHANASARVDVRQVIGSFADSAVLEETFDTAADVVFHLASIPGSLAERDAAAGREINLLAPLRMFDRVGQAALGHGGAPRVVFASSVAVYGTLGTEESTEDALPQPGLTYGAHKWMTEIDLADRTRRKELDARSIRLPGVVARPPAETGHGSAFMSQVFHRLAAGDRFDSPVTPEATSWWMSRHCCIDNLLHAGAAEARPSWPSSRTWQLPVVHATFAEVVLAIGNYLNRSVAHLVDWRPQEGIERLFGALPPLSTPRANAEGFRSDGGVVDLVEQVYRDLASGIQLGNV